MKISYILSVISMVPYALAPIYLSKPLSHYGLHIYPVF